MYGTMKLYEIVTKKQNLFRFSKLFNFLTNISYIKYIITL